MATFNYVRLGSRVGVIQNGRTNRRWFSPEDIKPVKDTERGVMVLEALNNGSYSATINPATDTVVLDGTTIAAGGTLDALETALVGSSVFLKPSSGGGGGSFATITGQPTDNANLASALAGKQDKPVTALRQSASRCFMARNLMSAGAGRWQKTTSMHFAARNLVNPVLVFPNWRVASSVESSPGSGTIEAIIEYPIGVYTDSTQTASGPIAHVSNTLMNFPNLTIPKGAQFWVTTIVRNDNGTVFIQFQSDYVNKFNGVYVDGWDSGTGVVPTLKSGRATPNSITYTPIIIATETSEPAILGIGDSIFEGGTEGATDKRCDNGFIARSLGKYYGYTSFAEAATTLSAYLAGSKTFRGPLTVYFTHLVHNYGMNDLGTGGTAVALVTSRQNLVLAYPALKVCGTTLMPYLGTTDGFRTLTAQNAVGGNNAKVIDFNTRVRNGETKEPIIFDIASVIDPNVIGKYPVAYNTLEGVLGYQAEFTGSIANGTTTLTVTAVASGSLVPGMPIVSSLVGLAGTYNNATNDVVFSTRIVQQLTGTPGGVGTYQINRAQFKNSKTMYAGGLFSADGLHITDILSQMIVDKKAVDPSLIKL